MDIEDPWPPHRCITVGDQAFEDLGEWPEGEYRLTYMKGALWGPSPFFGDLCWGIKSDEEIDGVTDGPDGHTGYYCHYKCPPADAGDQAEEDDGDDFDDDDDEEPEFDWEDEGTFEDTSVSGCRDLYGSWIRGEWRGSTQIKIYAWAKTAVEDSDGTLIVTWGGKKIEKGVTIPGRDEELNQLLRDCPMCGDGDGGGGENFLVATIVAEEGGDFEVR